MTNKGRKLDPPLHIEMPFDEAMRRFLVTKPEEVAELEEQAKQKKAARNDPDGLKRRPDRPPRKSSPG